MLLLAPAKVNLFLRIVGQRSDGYHLLDSLMVPISLYDDITMAVQNVTAVQYEKGEKAKPPQTLQISLSCDDPSIPSDETNLAYRAAALVCQEAQLTARITLHIAKRIPAGAGLGGGSSDAAAVLKGLNTAFGLDWTELRLCTLGAKLGADVPFFIPCQPAHVGGIGEELSPVLLTLDRWLVLIVPPFGVSTPWAYHRFDELGRKGSAVAAAASVAGQNWPVPRDCVNDLESAVLPAYPAIQEIKDALLACQADVTLMSGSGSAVFGIFPHEQAAQQAGKALAKKGRVFLVQPLAGAPSASRQRVE
jgi:4-diphosphocytidyl-2-C-methyl-D-erythritol kinase